jgi:NTP pyrophosphatase (non-canonical NTP hydrolase)
VKGLTAPVDRVWFMNRILGELDRAYAKHGAEPWSRHEFYAVLLEEVDELWDAIKADETNDHVIAEAVQVAAMCFRYAETRHAETRHRTRSERAGIVNYEAVAHELIGYLGECRSPVGRPIDCGDLWERLLERHRNPSGSRPEGTE